MERMKVFADSTINYYLNSYPLALPSGQVVSWNITAFSGVVQTLKRAYRSV